MPRCHLLPAAVLLLLLAGTAARAQDGPALRFETRCLSEEFHCEGAACGDLDQDGHADVVAGPWWYAGPGFVERHAIYEPRGFDKNGYSDNFFAFIHDIDGDSRPDVLVVGFPGKEAIWYRNPGSTGGDWKRHLVLDGVDNESPTFTDVDGDHRPELVCQHGGKLGWAAPAPGDPTAPWRFHPVSPRDIGGRFTHGLGAGDVDGDGRRDLLWKRGWFRQPASAGSTWQHHGWPFAGPGGAQMYTWDVDGDGDNDVLTAEDAHGYGLSWFEQVPGESGAAAFRRHLIMGRDPDDAFHDLVVGNLHAMALADMDGDGLKDLVTGNRHWAHNGGDPADHEPARLVCFLLRRSPDGGVRFHPHVIHGDSGVGTQVVVADADGNGLPDVVVGNKKGTFVHLQRRRKEPGAPAPEQEQPAQEDGSGGEAPRGDDGHVLNVDFETGDLTDWLASGRAFQGTPLEGDTVRARRPDMRSRHEGRFWVGTYEPERSDEPRGTLTSATFTLTRPYLSFLVGGGRWEATRVEVVRADTGRTVFKASGRNREDMHRVVADLSAHQGRRVFVRVVDASSGPWGHINFDHLRLHETPPRDAATGDLPAGFSPDEAARRMQVPAGFHVDLVAGEPDIHQPIALAIDHAGRLWVAEAHSYPVKRPEGEGRDRIVVLCDRDGDGSFETRHTFISGLNLVSGLQVGFGGVFVGAAPHLLFIPDRDGDLVPDGPPEVLLDGFGYQDTHETLNSFTWGPDGWLYGCHGVFTHSKVGTPGTPDAERVPINAGVWRYHPLKRRFEVFAWGTSNPWGIDFDDHGQAFITACVIPHLYHVVQGGRYRRQAGRHFRDHVYEDIGTVADHVHYLGSTPHAGNGISDSVGGGHAHCGALIYRGAAFPPAFRGRILMNNIHGNRVNTDLLERRGSGFVGRHGEDLLVARDAWFRGIALRSGPGGAVFLTDWYDRQACHRTTPGIWDRTNGRLYRIRYGKLKPVQVDLSLMSGPELAACHLRENAWYVRTARRLLQERGRDPAAEKVLLGILRKHEDPGRRLRALWTLHAMGALDRELALAQTRSPHEHLRAWAVQLLLEDRQASGPVLQRLGTMAREDPSPVVRLYLAAVLQRLPEGDRWGVAQALVRHSEDRDDPNIPLMIWYGVEPLAASAPARALELAGSSALPQVRRLLHRRLAAEGRAVLALVVEQAAEAGSAERLQILKAVRTAFERRDRVPMPAGWPDLAEELFRAGDPELRDLVLALSVAFGDRTAAPHLRRLLADTGLTEGRRKQALESLLRLRDPDLPALCHELLDDDAMRAPVLAALARFGHPDTPEEILQRFPELAPEERAAAASTLASRAPYARALLQAVLDGRLPRSVLDRASVRRQLTRLQDRRVDTLLKRAWGRAREPEGDKASRIRRFVKKYSKDALQDADRSRGRAVFARTCMSCHTLFGEGREVGPDLTGSNRGDLRYLLTNIVDPGAELANEYRMAELETDDGRIITGLLEERNAETVTISTTDATLVIPMSEVYREENGEPAIRITTESMMPEGQLDGLSDAEIRDLLAYLTGPGQVPMAAVERNLATFFNGRDLAGWEADSSIWSVEDAEIVGHAPGSRGRGGFAWSRLLFKDFRLIIEVRVVSGRGGIQFRSTALPDGSLQGYQAGVGPGSWGRLLEVRGRGLLSRPPNGGVARPGGWNTLEIVASGDRILMALNGTPCLDMRDPGGARRGFVGLHLRPGDPTEIRFRNPKLELDPHPRLATVP